jgi:hypothetical protein
MNTSEPHPLRKCKILLSGGGRASLQDSPEAASGSFKIQMQKKNRPPTI